MLKVTYSQLQRYLDYHDFQCRHRQCKPTLAFAATREGITRSVLGQLNNFFTPEFLNRFDGIIEFKTLSKENLLTIVELMLNDVNKMLAPQHLHIHVAKAVERKTGGLGL